MARHVNEKVRRRGYRNWIQWMVSQRLGWGRVEIPWNAPKGKVQAYVTEGVWFAYCPDESCRTPVIVDDREPSFFCTGCLNAANDGHPFTVEFAEKHEVEALFGKRKDPRTRNWMPGESLESLKKEQKAMGEL